jgi:predicted component of type VI protein secretion system
MKNFFDLFKRHPKTDKPSDPAMQMLLRSVSMTEEQELSCDDVYALMDQFAEMVKRGEDASHLMPMVQKHLNMCPDCREEYEALLKMMEDHPR